MEIYSIQSPSLWLYLGTAHWTKVILRKCLGRSSVNYIELNTLICEIECNLNNRPLTYLIDDINIDPISPSHLIMVGN